VEKVEVEEEDPLATRRKSKAKAKPKPVKPQKKQDDEPEELSQFTLTVRPSATLVYLLEKVVIVLYPI